MLTAINAPKPTREQTYAAAVLIGDALGERFAYVYRGAYHFRLGDGWTLALSADDAGRFRLEACRWTAAAVTLWALADDHERLAALASELVAEIECARSSA